MLSPNIPIITPLIKRYKRNRLRAIMRGYRTLKNNNKLYLLRQLRNKLASAPLLKNSKNKILNNNIENIDLSVRQFLITYLIFTNFNKAVLYATGKGRALKYPLPFKWQKVLINEGIAVNRVVCSLKWLAWILMLWCYGILILIKNIKALLTKKDLGTWVYFNNIRADSIPKTNKDYTIINWYLYKWQNHTKNLNTICHNTPNIAYQSYKNINIAYNNGLPKLTLLQSIYFVILSAIFVILSLLLLIVGKTHYAFMLGEYIKLLQVKLANKKQLAKDYMFHNSGLFYCPIWTYEAKVKGSRIIFYFYSTNDKNFQTKNNKNTVQLPWFLLTWPHYLVWYKSQLEYTTNPAIIEVVSPTWFSSAPTQLAKLNKNTIAVFDVSIIQRTFYIVLGLSIEYYIPNIARQFLTDIQIVLLENNIQMAHKIKRTSKQTHLQYKYDLKQLAKANNYLDINPDLSATALIKQTQATISMPFTSTALLAKEEGKPTVYYDPSGLIQKDDKAAHGIIVLIGINELRQWVKTINNA